MPRRLPVPNRPTAEWTLLTNHAHVLVCLSRDSTQRMRNIALLVGVTERAVQRIVKELTADGFIVVSKVGRNNHYSVNDRLPLRHPLEAHRTVRDLLALVR